MEFSIRVSHGKRRQAARGMKQLAVHVKASSIRTICWRGPCESGLPGRPATSIDLVLRPLANGAVLCAVV